MANSFPIVVGDAGCPCVRASIGMSANVSARSAIAANRFSKDGCKTSRDAPAIIRPIAKLLMSHEVHPKWASDCKCERSWARRRSRNQYSAALTSWRVDCSCRLTSSAASGRAASSERISSADGGVFLENENSGNSVLSHSISTSNRWRISARSPKRSASGRVSPQ